MRTAASLRRAIVVTAVSFLAANAALVFPARAAWRAHYAAQIVQADIDIRNQDCSIEVLLAGNHSI